MATSSAPATLFLVGEHAVVYGEPALLCAVDLRARVTAERADEDGMPSPYVRRAVERVRARLDDATPLSVGVESGIPVGAGLGSSAAVSVAAADAAARELGSPLGTEEAAEVGWRAERDVQGEASRADTYASAVGGFVRVEGDDAETVEVREEPEFIVGYDGGSSPTASMVERVSDLVDRNEVAEGIVSEIGSLTDTAVDAVRGDPDADRLGEAMDINHGLLEALGVSSSSLSRMVWAARDAGGHAKLTGAGGAGCVVALAGGDGGATVEGVRAALDDAAQTTYEVSTAEGVRSE